MKLGLAYMYELVSKGITEGVTGMDRRSTENDDCMFWAMVVFILIGCVFSYFL